MTYLLRGLGFCRRLVDRPRVVGFQLSSWSSSGSSRFSDALGRKEYFSCAFSGNGGALLLFASNSAIFTKMRELNKISFNNNKKTVYALCEKITNSLQMTVKIHRWTWEKSIVWSKKFNTTKESRQWELARWRRTMSDWLVKHGAGRSSLSCEAPETRLPCSGADRSLPADRMLQRARARQAPSSHKRNIRRRRTYRLL